MEFNMMSKAYIMISFLGDDESMYDIFRFLETNLDKKILVYDASTNRKIFEDILGGTSKTPVLYNQVVYTTESDYAWKKKENYDITLIYINDLINIEDKKIFVDNSDMVFYSYSPYRASYRHICKLARAYKKRDESDNLNLIYRNYDQDLTTDSILHVIHDNMKVYCLPRNEKDIKCATKIDYGYLNTNYLSDRMQEFLSDVVNKSQQIMLCM